MAALNMMSEFFVVYFDSLTDLFLNPQRRLFFGYLLSALLIALVWGVSRGSDCWRTGVLKVCKTLGSRRIWASPSAIGDYKLIVGNQAFLLVLMPLLISRATLAATLYLILRGWCGEPPSTFDIVPGWLIALTFTSAHFLLDDGSRYIVHRALHRYPFLWAFHKVHHCATSMTPLTVLRTHPVESVVFVLRAGVVHALSISVFLVLFGDRLGLTTVLGVQLFLFMFNLFGANLRHSPLPIGYGHRVERWLISPAQHQVHHSIAARHRDRNFGAVLSIWDRWGGTLYCSNAAENRCLVPGLSGAHRLHSNRLLALYFVPVIEAGANCGRSVRRLCNWVVANAPGRWSSAAAVGVVLLLAASAPVQAATELNVYSHRQPFLIAPFLELYEAKTGIKVNVVYASKGLAQRLEAEGARSPADVILTVDVGRLNVYADKDLLAPIESPVLMNNIPSNLRDAENRWFALSTRARVIAYAKDRIDGSEITHIEDLAHPKWKGKICSRPGSHVYNRALLSSMIAANGVEAARSWAAGLVGNLARRPQGNDRAQIKAIFEGVCDLTIVNSYYFGKLRNSDVPEQREWVENIGILFTNQADRGNHVNISGGGVAKHSKNKKTAVEFLEFLTTPEAQALYGKINYEYPVNPKAPVGDEVESWGAFVPDPLPIAEIAKLGPVAQRIIDSVGW